MVTRAGPCTSPFPSLIPKPQTPNPNPSTPNPKPSLLSVTLTATLVRLHAGPPGRDPPMRQDRHTMRRDSPHPPSGCLVSSYLILDVMTYLR